MDLQYLLDNLRNMGVENIHENTELIIKRPQSSIVMNNKICSIVIDKSNICKANYKIKHNNGVIESIKYVDYGISRDLDIDEDCVSKIAHDYFNYPAIDCAIAKEYIHHIKFYQKDFIKDFNSKSYNIEDYYYQLIKFIEPCRKSFELSIFYFLKNIKIVLLDYDSNSKIVTIEFRNECFNSNTKYQINL